MRIMKIGSAGQRWNRSGFFRPDPNGKFQNLRQSTCRWTGFLQKVFVHCLMHLMKNFQKRGGMGEVLNFVTPKKGSQNKNAKNFFAFFANITQF